MNKKSLWRSKSWWVGIVAFVVMMTLAVLNATGDLPGWIYWCAFGMYIVGMVTYYVYAFTDRPQSWRVTDSRTTEGDARGTGWAKDE